MTQGGGRGFAKCHLTFFSNNFSHIFGFWAKLLRTFFEKIKMSHHTGWGGGYGPLSQNDTGVGGVKNQSKSVTYYLNGP
jgi:hypothetical protein